MKVIARYRHGIVLFGRVAIFRRSGRGAIAIYRV